jgi:hypothetical protein
MATIAGGPPTGAWMAPPPNQPSMNSVPPVDTTGMTGVNTTQPPASSLIGRQPLFVGGWAAEFGALGTGIEGIDVYLDGLPEQGGTFLGSATYGLPRPDVAEAYGNPEWMNSGFAFAWTPQNLAVGDHTITVLARSMTGMAQMQTVAAVNCLCEQSPWASPTTPEVIENQPGIGQLEDTGGPNLYFDRDQTGD